MKETPLQYRDRLLSLLRSRDPLKVLETTPMVIRRIVAGRTLEQLAWKPEPARWSVTQILAHLSDTETVGAWRFRSVIGQNGVALQPFDQDQWAHAFRYEHADPFESLELFAVTRAGTLRVLRRIDPALMDNHGIHGERGEESVRHLVNLYAGHDLNHLGQIEQLLAQAPAVTFRPSPVRAETAAPDSLDVRVGTIESLEAIAGSRKLMKLRVSFGDHKRTIVAGIRQERAEPQALVGRQALFVLNIPPRTIAGVESGGMLFDVGHADGLLPALVMPERVVPDGARVG
jgi:methionine--tRNA ligase beta chain